MEHNNQSMATVVETFFIEETINLIHDNDALQKWNERVQELGLEGQKQVMVDGKSPIPFLWMNEGLIKTFEVLCPRKTGIEKYSQTPIPVELLEIVSLCKREQYFDNIKVWYNDKEKDPVIVGYKVDEEYVDRKDEWYGEHYSKKYLIGRWADVKASLDSLIQRAIKLFTFSETVRLKQEIREKQRDLEDIEAKVLREFGGAMPSTDLPF